MKLFGCGVALGTLFVVGFLLWVVVVAPTRTPERTTTPMPRPTVATVATPAPTVAPMPITAAERAYIANAAKARQLVPFKIPLEVGGAKIPLPVALDALLLETAKARHQLSLVKPPARFAKAHATFESALDEMYAATKAARAANEARDADGFNRANLARIEASKRVNLASQQYGEAMKR